MIESTKRPPTTMYTDHSATVSIAKQTSLSSTNTDKLNLRLVRASQYLSIFELDIRYKPGIKNIVPDALSRLLRNRVTASKSDEGILETLFNENVTYVHAASLVEMSTDFRQRLAKALKEDDVWAGVLRQAETPSDNKGAHFVSKDGLLYHISDRSRLVIPRSLEGEIFALAHQPHHAGFHRTYGHISESLYVKNLSSRLRKFLEHCPKCLLFQTRRHSPYGQLQSIRTVDIPFHTISMDFVLALPLSIEGFECMLTITDKFSKRVSLIPGHSTHSAET